MKIFLFMLLSFMVLGFTSTLFTSSPSLLIFWLVIMTFDLSLMLGLWINSWMMYAVILLFAGGMMVLFMYMVTLMFSLKIIFLSYTKLFMSIWVLVLLMNTKFPYSELLEFSISSLYLVSGSKFLGLMAIYLLLVLMTIVKLASSLSGPLKSFFKNEV